MIESFASIPLTGLIPPDKALAIEIISGYN
jgi:hypothetical protein